MTAPSELDTPPSVSVDPPPKRRGNHPPEMEGDEGDPSEGNPRRNTHTLAPEVSESLDRLRLLIRSDAECDALEAARRLERTETLRDQAGFPRRAWAFVREGKCEGGPWAEKRQKLRDLIIRADGCLAAIVGPQGTGKTCLAVDALCTATARLRTARFDDVAGLVAKLRDAHVKGQLEATLTALENPAALVVDQWDKAPGTDWETRYLFRLLDRRYNEGRWTLLVANVPPLPAELEALPPGDPRRAEWIASAFGGLVGPSVLGRINETGGLVIADWPSFRK